MVKWEFDALDLHMCSIQETVMATRFVSLTDSDPEIGRMMGPVMMSGLMTVRSK